MDAAERIADYLSDDLAPDEREAFEAELARDAALRAQLDAVRRGDVALASIAPTALPDGFAERLRASLDAELAEVLAPTPTEERDPRVAAQAELGQRDDLAARRAARAVPRWVGGLAGAAAAALVVVAGIAGLNGLGSGADQEAPESATGEAFDADGGSMEIQEAPAEESLEAETEGTEEVEEEAAEDDAGESADTMGDEGAAAAMGRFAPPVLVAQGRSLDDEQLDDVLMTPDLADLAAQRLSTSEGETLAAEFADRWQATAADGTGTAVRYAGNPTDADREAVAECLTSADDAGRRTGIPAYAEIADYEGIPAVVLGLVTLDPSSDTWSVPEVQVLDRTTCDLLAARP
ncbi:MAG: hypothetical protein WD378_09010 [Egicoccus sp.]